MVLEIVMKDITSQVLLSNIFCLNKSHVEGGEKRFLSVSRNDAQYNNQQKQKNFTYTMG